MKLSTLKKTGLLAGLSAVSYQAAAEVPAAVTTQITSVQTDLATIGAAILVLSAVAMGYRWLKAMFF